MAVGDVGVGSWPWRRARITPDNVALVQGESPRTYGELAERVGRLAGALASHGVGPGDRVAYVGRNDLATFEVFFATGLLGAVSVQLNNRLSGVELGWMLHDCEPTVLVHGPDASPALAVIAPGAMTVPLVLALDPASSPFVAVDYEAFVHGGKSLDELPAVGVDDPCVMLYTSGTTGRPKGAVLTHGNLLFNTLNQLAHVDIVSTERALCIAPLFHVTGLGQVTMPTLFKGGTVVVVPKFDAGEVLATIGREGVTAFSAVPTMLQMMCEHPGWDAADLSTLRTVVYGGSPVQERVARAWLDRGVQVVQGYGMTEASPGVFMGVQDGSAEHPTSIGLPHFFTDVAMLAGDELVPATPGAAGELLVRGPNVFSGYWRRDQDTADAFVDGWFRTGDVVRVGADGWADVVDRVKDMIISGGENIYPAEIEAVAVQLPDVALCAVVAVPDERWGEVGSAFVVLRPGATVTLDDVRAHLAANLARYKLPRDLVQVDELPHNATGKIRRDQLRETARLRPPIGPSEGS